MAQVKLKLDLKDVYKKPLKETVDVVIKSHITGNLMRIPFKPGTTDITGLEGAPQGRYRIDIDPASYQLVSSLAINMKASGTTSFSFTFPVDPAKVTRVDFPNYPSLNPDLKSLLERSDKVLGYEGRKGQDLYEALDDIRRAGLLNIAVKTDATRYSNGRTSLSYIQQLTQLRGDRFFAAVPKELRDETKNSIASGLFKDADQSQHKPPDGFVHADSFKTHDRYGNLQLSFFNKGDEYSADIDIDDAGGFEHFFQVLNNFLSGKPTHPYNIHEILVATQELDPGYTFVL